MYILINVRVSIVKYQLFISTLESRILITDSYYRIIIDALDYSIINKYNLKWKIQIIKLVLWQNILNFLLVNIWATNFTDNCLAFVASRSQGGALLCGASIETLGILRVI